MSVWISDEKLLIFASLIIILKLYQFYGLRCYRVFSLKWPASMQIYWNKRKRLHNKGFQLRQDSFRTPTWPPFHCFGTPIWLP